MKVAILNISIGDYIVFWKDFYLTARKNFLIDCEKEFYVFTDKVEIYARGENDVHVFYQENMGWPFNTMKRFSLFQRILDQLSRFDYVFFANGNALFVKPLTKDLIQKEIITVEHPGMHFTSNYEAPYERRPESNAYVAYGNEKKYVQGAFYGGKYENFKDMVTELNKKTEEDLDKNIIAIWHDESFLNHYVSYNRNIQILGWQYMKYEEYVMPYEPVIMLRNKRKYISNQNGRFKGQNYIKQDILLFVRNFKWKIMILLGKIKRTSTQNSIGKWIDLDISNDNKGI